MDMGRCIKEGLVGGFVGVFLGAILWVPSCVVGTVAKGTERLGESVANSIFWISIAGSALISFFIALAEETKKDAERERAELDRRRYAEEQDRLEQVKIHSSLVQTAGTSLTLFESMPTRLLTSEQMLDQAERDFDEGAFSPFWSSIEKATVQLGAFDDGVRTIRQNIASYGELKKRYRDNSPSFPIAAKSVRNIAAANSTTDRLNAIVRKAQRNFQFATIYEQRKTNQILAAGFTTLAQALDGMGHRIASSIDDLGGKVSEMSDMLEGSLNEIHATNVSLKESIDNLHGTVRTEASESKKRADRDWEALDNIQRHRKPIGIRDKDFLGTEPAP